MKYSFLCIFLMISLSCRAQSIKIPKLTKQEMQEDINFLYHTILEVNPHLGIREKITNTNLRSELFQLCESARHLKTFEEFYYLACNMLFLCQDQHDALQSFYPAELEKKNIYIYPKSVALSEVCEEKYDKYYATSLSLIYIDGQYYKADRISNSISKSVLIPTKVQIVKVNDLPIDEYIAQWSRKVDPTIRWDNIHKKYYSYRLYPPAITGLSTTKYDIAYQKDDTIATVNLKVPLEETGYANFDYDAKVLYFSKQKILYIRVPDMELSYLELFEQQIIQYKDSNINKVVIDIRDNGGGSDIVWFELLSLIIDQPIVVNLAMYVRDNDLIFNYLTNIRGKKIDKEKYPLLTVDSTTYFRIADDADTILPKENSINYSGKIYVLVNERCFSSSLAFSATCNKSEKLITVGQPTHWIGGRGITPFFFAMPNSKLIFEITPTLDNSQVHHIEDYYNNYVKIDVPLTIDDYYIEFTYSGKRYDKSYLLQYDKVFRKIIEQ